MIDDDVSIIKTSFYKDGTEGNDCFDWSQNGWEYGRAESIT